MKRKINEIVRSVFYLVYSLVLLWTFLWVFIIKKVADLATWLIGLEVVPFSKEFEGWFKTAPLSFYILYSVIAGSQTIQTPL